MADTSPWITRLATTTFVAHPDRLARVQNLYVERLNEIPVEQARIHFISGLPTPEDNEFFLWDLRCTAVHEALRCGIPEPESLELFTVHCVISVNPDFEEEVHEKLFFADHAGPDPFPGFLNAVDVEPFVPGQAWTGAGVTVAGHAASDGRGARGERPLRRALTAYPRGTGRRGDGAVILLPIPGAGGRRRRRRTAVARGDSTCGRRVLPARSVPPRSPSAPGPTGGRL